MPAGVVRHEGDERGAVAATELRVAALAVSRPTRSMGLVRTTAPSVEPTSICCDRCCPSRTSECHRPSVRYLLLVGEPHVGLILPNYGDALDAERLASVAVIAEEAGFDSGWVTDHLIVPAELAPVYGTIAEALVSLGFLAGRTRRLQLGVSALIVPQRNPFVTLKQVTSLDFLSGGRIVMAVAAGWIEKEFETLGSTFEGRGRRLDDWLQLARSAFAQMPGPVEHAGGLPIADGWLAPGLVRSAGSRYGWLASPRPRFAALAEPACGTRSRCRPRSSRSWRTPS